MGIKGRRKKLRERAEREQAEGAPGGGGLVEARASATTAEVLAKQLTRGQALAGTAVDEDGAPVDLPPMKTTEFFDTQDQAYLEQAKLPRRGEAGPPRKAKRSERPGDALAATADADAPFRQDAAAAGNRARGAAAEVSGPSFSHPATGLEERVADGLALAGFRSMTVIQARAVPLALQGYDLLGQAKTGSGKTLAFAVPIVHEAVATVVRTSTATSTPVACLALVLSPTKELCAQINHVFGHVLRYVNAADATTTPPRKELRLKSELITGGTKLSEERRRLVEATVVVGTPGRVLDHLRHTSTWTVRSALKCFVMDEADRLLADGFRLDLDSILAALPNTRQTFLFSATNSKSVRELARVSLRPGALFVSTRGNEPRLAASAEEEEGAVEIAPSYVDFEGAGSGEDDDGDTHHAPAGPEDAETIPSTLRQFCRIVPVHERLRALYVFTKLAVKTGRKALVFCSTVASTQFHCMMLGAVGFHDDVLMLHGKMKHRQRLATFEEYCARDAGVLFCTDVAARGLDIPRVDVILQFDPPTDPTEYVHRIGRTARAGATGTAVLFLAPFEQPFVTYLERFSIRLEVLPQEPVPDLQLSLQRVLDLDPIVAKQAEAAFRAHVAAYQAHVLKSVFDVRNLQLEDLAIAFALTTVPSVTLPKFGSQEEKQAEYVKGRLNSMKKRQFEARAEYERMKTKQQWSEEGQFVGMKRPAPSV